MFLLTGLYRGIWRYASLPDLFNIARAATLTVLIFLPVDVRADPARDAAALDPADQLVRADRAAWARRGSPIACSRTAGSTTCSNAARQQSVPVLLISAATAPTPSSARRCATRSAVYRVVGVLADTRSRVGREIYGVPVLGTIDSLETVVARLDRRGKRPQKLIITAQNLPGDQVRGLLDRADALAIPLARLPRLTDLAPARRSRARSRARLEPIALEDLLGRPQAVLDRDGDGAAGPRAPGPGHRRRRHDRRRAVAPDRGAGARRGWSCSTTANSRSTRSTSNCASGFRNLAPVAAAGRRARPRRRSTRSSPPSGPRSCSTPRR